MPQAIPIGNPERVAAVLVLALGARAAEALSSQLSLHTVGDLLRHYPRRYVDRGRLTDIAGLEIGEHITVVAQVEKATLRDMRSRSGTLLAVVIRDEKGAELDCTFFHGHRLKSLVKPGVRAVFSGKVGVFNRKLQLTHPQFETLDEDVVSQTMGVVLKHASDHVRAAKELGLN